MTAAPVAPPQPARVTLPREQDPRNPNHRLAPTGTVDGSPVVERSVPRVTLVTRKAYGGASIAMNARSLGATRVFAWPGAEVAVVDEIVAPERTRTALAGAIADALDADPDPRGHHGNIPL